MESADKRSIGQDMIVANLLVAHFICFGCQNMTSATLVEWLQSLVISLNNHSMSTLSHVPNIIDHTPLHSEPAECVNCYIHTVHDIIIIIHALYITVIDQSAPKTHDLSPSILVLLCGRGTPHYCILDVHTQLTCKHYHRLHSHT